MKFNRLIENKIELFCNENMHLISAPAGCVACEILVVGIAKAPTAMVGSIYKTRKPLSG